MGRVAHVEREEVGAAVLCVSSRRLVLLQQPRLVASPIDGLVGEVLIVYHKVAGTLRGAEAFLPICVAAGIDDKVHGVVSIDIQWGIDIDGIHVFLLENGLQLVGGALQCPVFPFAYKVVSFRVGRCGRRSATALGVGQRQLAIVDVVGSGEIQSHGVGTGGFHIGQREMGGVRIIVRGAVIGCSEGNGCDGSGLYVPPVSAALDGQHMECGRLVLAEDGCRNGNFGRLPAYDELIKSLGFVPIPHHIIVGGHHHGWHQE